MSTHSLRRMGAMARPLVLSVALVLVVLCIAGAARPGQAQGPAPHDPLALDSNPAPAVPVAPAQTPPPNDYFTQTLVISNLSYYNAEDTSLATRQTEDPAQTCTNGTSAHSVWYQYTATSASPITANTYGSNYDTVLSVHTGSWGAMTMVACNDDANGQVTYSLLTFTPSVGVTYYFQVTSWNGSAAGNLAFGVRVPNVPVNDLITGTLTIPTALPYTYSQDVSGAGYSPEDPIQGNGGQSGDCSSGGQNDDSVWYQYTATSGTPLTAYTFGSNYDTVLSVHTGTWPLLSEIVCNNDQNATVQSQVFFTPTVGVNYYFMITRRFAASAPPMEWLQFSLRSGAPPTNDFIASAKLMGAMPYGDSIDTYLATASSSDPVIPCTSPPAQQNRTVWYRYTPASSGTLVIDTFGSEYDTVLAVWTGTPPSLSNVGCSDDYNGPQSRVTVALHAGTTYYVEVASKSGQSGSLLQLHAHDYAPLWQARAPMGLARDRLAVTSDGAYLYAIGGEHYFTDAPRAYGPTNLVSRYDPATDTWTNLAPVPVAIQDHKAVYVAGKIYIPAGYTDSGPPFYGTHLVYTIATNSWSTAAPAPWPGGRPPVYYSLVSDGQGYYLTGGYDGAQILSNVWYYNAAADTWTSRASMGNARFGHLSAYIAGRLYVVAGDDDGVVPGLFSTERYDPGTNTWTPLAAQYTDRLFAGGAVLPGVNGSGLWYITGGGFSSFGAVLATTEVFDPAVGLWQLLPEEYDLQVPRYHLGAATASGQIYAVGGFNNTTPGTLDSNERLTLASPTAVTATGLEGYAVPGWGLPLLGLGLALALALAAAGIARRVRARRAS